MVQYYQKPHPDTRINCAFCLVSSGRAIASNSRLRLLARERLSTLQCKDCAKDRIRISEATTRVSRFKCDCRVGSGDRSPRSSSSQDQSLEFQSPGFYGRYLGDPHDEPAGTRDNRSRISIR